MSEPTQAAPAAFALEEVLAATGGDLVRLGARTRFPGVTTDSRSLRPDELFVALRGEAHDGHAFLGEAVERGAGAVVVERAHAERPLRCGVIAVRDTLAALGDLAAFHRRRCRPRIVAVTGSNGKTTTKEMLAAILARALGPGRVLRTTGTQNNLVGLPLTLLRLAGTEEAAILELGMNGPGEIWRLAALGEMRELGDEAPRAHRELGAAAAAARLDALFLLGPHAGEVRAGAEAAGLPAERITIAASHDELAARLAAYCRAGDLVLLKGSRGAAMEEVLRRLTADASGERRP